MTLEICTICLEENLDVYYLCNNTCKYKYCLECVEKYVINAENVLQCPTCNKPIGCRELLNILKKKYIDLSNDQILDIIEENKIQLNKAGIIFDIRLRSVANAYIGLLLLFNFLVFTIQIGNYIFDCTF